VVGVERPVYQGKDLVGTIREFSDSLLMFGLKAKRPEVYRERRDVQIKGELSLSQLMAELASS
jgi:hypothetical protein